MPFLDGLMFTHVVALFNVFPKYKLQKVAKGKILISIPWMSKDYYIEYEKAT